MHTNEVLDRVLQAISQTQPPPGMDDRLLQTLHSHAKASAHSPRLWARPAWAVAAALLLAVVLLPLALRRPAPARTSQSAPSTIAGSHAAVPIDHLRPTRRPTLRRRTPAPLESQLPRAQAALVESFPAPPQPLTPQEKLLLRIVHRGDPDQLATLDPWYRLEREAADQADFDSFFQPPAPAFGEPLPLLPTTGDTK